MHAGMCVQTKGRHIWWQWLLGIYARAQTPNRFTTKNRRPVANFYRAYINSFVILLNLNLLETLTLLRKCVSVQNVNRILTVPKRCVLRRPRVSWAPENFKLWARDFVYLILNFKAGGHLEEIVALFLNDIRWLGENTCIPLNHSRVRPKSSN